MLFNLMWCIIKCVLILSWRFFSGAHMNGRIYNDSSWWYDASVRYRTRQGKGSWWKSKSRIKRAWWRWCFFWPSFFLVLGFIFFPLYTLALIAFFLPVGIYVNRYRLKCIFFQPFVATLSDGTKQQHWMLRGKYRRFLLVVNRPRGMRRRPGLATTEELRGEKSLAEIPVDYERAVRAELAEELNGQPPIELKLLLDPDVDF